MLGWEGSMTLGELHARGLIDQLDLQLARALVPGHSETDAKVALAVALASRSVRHGHACFPVGLGVEELWPSESVPAGILPAPRSWAEALRTTPLTSDGPLVLDDAGRLYLRRYWALENDIALQLSKRSNSISEQPNDASIERLARLFQGGARSPQARAAHNALRYRVSLLCGGPGTGKTTTVAAIVALLIEEAHAKSLPTPKIMLLAPTGKAAARLGEAVRHAKRRINASESVLQSIPNEASTVQRALGMRRTGLRFSRDADNPLEADVIVVDEASMIDLVLMRQLLEAMRPNARLLIVGDPDQLTSVEAGCVLTDLVRASSETWWSGRVTTLEKTHRYDATQPLGRLVAAIRSGDADVIERLRNDEASEDVVWKPSSHLEHELDRAARRWSEMLSASDARAHFRMRGAYVVLTPFRRGLVGTHRIGEAIEARLSTGFNRRPALRPLIIEENSSELDLYNGDFALLRIGEGIAVVGGADGIPREIAESRLPHHSDAYALSIHKAQGSEFDELLVVLPDETAPLLTRELLYTAVSRARARVRIVGPSEVFFEALRQRVKRHSGLVDAIRKAGEVERFR